MAQAGRTFRRSLIPTVRGKQKQEEASFSCLAWLPGSVEGVDGGSASARQLAELARW